MEKKITEVNYVKVTNRNSGTTTYVLSNGQRRTFAVNETKKIDLEELKEVNAIPGGEYLLRNYLIIDDKSALDFLNIQPEPEYFYTDVEIKKLLLEGSLDQLEDCLTFAPNGVIDLIKKIAIDLKLPDTRKRDMILLKTGFSVDNAIRVNEVLDVEDTAPTEEKTTEQKLAKNPGFFDWFGLLMTSFILPGVLCYVFGKVFRKIGWIKDNDLLLEN